MAKSYINSKGLSIILIFVISIFFWGVCRYRPPLGDDVLGQHMHSVYFYTNSDRWNAEEVILINSFEQILENAKEAYLLWTGRIVHLFFLPLLNVWGQGFTAMTSVIIYIGITLAACRLLYGKIRNVLEHPVEIAIMLSVLCLYNSAVSHSIMWTMITIYSASVFLYLVILNMNEEIINRIIEKSEKRIYVAVFNLIGLIAGMTCELIGAWFILQIILRVLVKLKIKGSFKIIKYYLGLFIGYCLCFFAPGNFNRMLMPHDKEIYTSYFIKLLRSLEQHGRILTQFEGFGKILMYSLSIIGCVAIILYIKQKKWKKIVGVISFFSMIILSVFLWAFVSYTPIYGLLGVLVYQLLACFYIIKEDDLLNIKKYISIIILICLFSDNIFWFTNFLIQIEERNIIVREAIEKGEEEIKVRKLENADRKILFVNEIDDSNQYEKKYYQSYYGIKIIIE